MALDVTQLENDLLAMYDDMASRTSNPQQARQDSARLLAQAIERFVKSGNATGTITTTGSATTQTATVQLPIQ